MAFTANELLNIAEYIKSHQDNLKVSDKALDIYEGNLKPYVKEALHSQLQGGTVIETAERLPDINIATKIVNKLSTLYSEPPRRFLEGGQDDEVIEARISEIQLDQVMAQANIYFNACKRVALEPYIHPETRTFKVRAIPASEFLVMGTNPIDPSLMTVFIKCMGTVDQVQDDNSMVTKKKYWVYSDTSFAAITEDGYIIPGDMGDTQGENILGFIPFVYINKSRGRIMPVPDESLVNMSVLIPVLLSDVNFAAKYQVFSIIYGIDVNIDNLEVGPSNFWKITSQEEGLKPQIGTITPSADINKMIFNIQSQLAMWLETRNLSPSSVGKVDGDTGLSGIALMIKNIDTTEDRKSQQPYFQQAERDLFSILQKITEINPGALKDATSLSDPSSLSVKYAEQKAFKADLEVVQEVQLKREMGLIGKKQALRELYPNCTSGQIDSMMEEHQEEIQSLLEALPSEGTGQAPEGTGEADS